MSSSTALAEPQGAPADDAGDLDALSKMIHTFTIALTAARVCEHSPGHSVLWAAVLSLVTPVSQFRETAEKQRFLSFQPYLYLTEIGLVLYTVSEDHRQINLNVVIPKDSATGLSIIDAVMTLLTQTYPDAVLNLRPLCTHFFMEEDLPAPVPRQEQRHFITSRHQVSRLVFDEERQTVRLGRQSVRAVFVLRRPTDVVDFRPAATMRSDDPPDTLYWHAFYDGFAERSRAPRPDAAPCRRLLQPADQPVPGPPWPDLRMSPRACSTPSTPTLSRSSAASTRRP